MSTQETALPEPSNLAVLQKLHAVMKAVTYIQKDKQNEHFRYKYASEAAIKTALHSALVENGVIPQFNIVAITEREIPKFKDGKPATSEWLTTAQMYYRFTDVETGQYVEGTFFGCGVDAADKGIYKATTGAIKYILTSQFLIPTGDDPEKDDDRATDKLKRQAAKVDTGGAPVGTKEAAQNVAQRKIAAPAFDKFKMLDMFKGKKSDLKKLTGSDDIYYQVLHEAHLEHANEITTREKGIEVLDKLKAAFEVEYAAKTL